MWKCNNSRDFARIWSRSRSCLVSTTFALAGCRAPVWWLITSLRIPLGFSHVIALLTEDPPHGFPTKWFPRRDVCRSWCSVPGNVHLKPKLQCFVRVQYNFTIWRHVQPFLRCYAQTDCKGPLSLNIRVRRNCVILMQIALPVSFIWPPGESLRRVGHSHFK